MRNRCSFPAGAFSDQIRSEVTGSAHTYATRSSIGAPGLGRGAGGIGFAGIAGAVEGGGVSMAAGITGLPGAGPPGAFEGAGGTVATGTAGLPAAGPPGAVEGGGGGTIAAANVGSAGAVGGGGITMVAGTTGLSGTGSSGGIDGIGTSWRRSGVSAGFSKGGATLTSAPVFGLGAVSWRRFGWGAATRGAFAFPRSEEHTSE